MKKFKNWLLALMFVPVILFMAACGGGGTLVSNVPSSDKYTITLETTVGYTSLTMTATRLDTDNQMLEIWADGEYYAVLYYENTYYAGVSMIATPGETPETVEWQESQINELDYNFDDFDEAVKMLTIEGMRQFIKGSPYYAKNVKVFKTSDSSRINGVKATKYEFQYTISGQTYREYIYANSGFILRVFGEGGESINTFKAFSTSTSTINEKLTPAIEAATAEPIVEE